MDKVEIAVRAWKCSKCDMIYTDEYLADKCCVEKKCAICGKTLPKAWYSMMCSPCAEKKIFDSAKKMTWDEYQHKYPNHMIVLGYDYYHSVNELMDRWMDDVYPDKPDKDKRPQYAWGTYKEFMRVDTEYAILNATEDAYEDADFPEIAKKELFDFIEEWNKKYEQVYYCEDNTLAVLIPWEEWDEKGYV